jgi:RHS repeat-associated protein
MVVSTCLCPRTAWTVVTGAPALSSDGASSAAVEGTLNSAAVTTFRVEFFANAACDLSGSGEGESYLGFIEATTDVNGAASFSAVLAEGVTPGQFVAATATDPNGNTSEFSACQESIQTSTSFSQNWHYEYDPLSRLTYACNDWNAVTETCDGSFFQYTYDATGNRLTQTTELLTNNYAYDPANRLTSVDGLTYTYDNNGNLTNDSANTYTYDYANRMVGLTDGVNSYSYAYNGRGDRLQQTVNGVITNYTLDLNAGLPQVLFDGTSQYLYGNGRIGEYAAGQWAYYATDALGSVRQIVDASGQVVFYQGYAPFGEVRVSAGQGGSMFGFGGEQTDESGLQYLRARYLSTTTGRFITRDGWKGINQVPNTLNRYTYATSNPVILKDPSGHFAELPGPVAFARCFELHSLFEGNYEASIGNIEFIYNVSAQDAVDICKQAFSPGAWNFMSSTFNLDASTPTTAHELFGWYLYEVGGGQNYFQFDGNHPLTQELAASWWITLLRYKYYLLGDVSDYVFQKFNKPQFLASIIADGLKSLDDMETRNWTQLTLPLSFVLGSFYYQIVSIDNGKRIGFRIDNDTTLESGTHIAGRFPPDYKGSVEELLMVDASLGRTPLYQVIERNGGAPQKLYQFDLG